jgi:hypothetical protein
VEAYVGPPRAGWVFAQRWTYGAPQTRDPHRSRLLAGVAIDSEIFLDKQAQILETQNEHLKEEHTLRLAHLQHQLTTTL